MSLTSLSPVQGLQSFVDQDTNILVATSTPGTPGAGNFYSSIVGRVAIPDFSQDLRPRMGIERIQVQQIFQSQSEFGPNGEPVNLALNDSSNLIRYVGSWSSDVPGSGVRTVNSGNWTSANDYIEVTFYGTGLNLVRLSGMNAPMIATLSVDGNSAGTVALVPTSASGILVNRNYSPNIIVNVISNLSLGIHTVKMAGTSGNADGLQHNGFEILNESSSVKVNPGASYINGKKLSLAAQSSFSYSAPVTGVRGGRVLVYQASDGSIGQAFQAVNGSSATLTSADHSNEEVVRTYHFKEFGAGRSDDFSTLAYANRANAFTLDDGTTTLHNSGAANQRIDLSNQITLQGFEVNGGWITFTFIGTGLDVFKVDSGSGGSDNYNIQIDGGSTISLPSAGSTIPFVQKIVSGLPYGTHTVRWNRVTAAAFNINHIKFIVYQPKKPTLPSGAVELADYNVMANFVANTTGDILTMSLGVLRKSCVREMTYVGTWAISSPNTSDVSGANVNTSTGGSYFEYTFFGTGYDFRGPGNTATATVSLQSLSTGGSLLSATVANFPSLTSSAYGGYVFSAGTLTQNAGGNGSGYIIKDLPLGLWKVRHTLGSGAPYFDCLDIITPIHSHKSNLYADLQNTLTVGSQGISDNRKLTPVNDSVEYTRWAKTADTDALSITSSIYVPVAKMNAVHLTTGGPVKVTVNVPYEFNSSGRGDFALYIDGVLTDSPVHVINNSASGGSIGSIAHIQTIVYLSPGAHHFCVAFRINTGTTVTLSQNSTYRTMLIEEI